MEILDAEESAFQTEEQQQYSFRKIEELESFGINKTDIIKLKSGGYHTIESVSHVHVVLYYS